MEMQVIVLTSAVILTVAYFTYGRLLSRLFQLNEQTETPAVTLRDDLDYVPCEPAPLLSQHFSAIAAAGPIVGPILAGVSFGWLPALLWILIGSIFIGGVHDLGALVASIRHRATSIIEVVRIHISGRAYMLFLVFVWLALVYIVVAFTDMTANMFIGAMDPVTGISYKAAADVPAGAAGGTGTIVFNGGIATSSLIYLILPMIMGLVVRSGAMSMERATWIFLPLVGLAIWGGQYVPFNLDQLIQRWNPSLTSAEAATYAVRGWDVFLLLYCAIASVTPMWLLLQPRGQLGGYFLYAALAAGALGILLGGQPIGQPAWTSWSTPRGTVVPMLFITIACGACSGFHSLICSGTTSKQLRNEKDARPIGYGAMLLEAMVAIVSLCCVMMIPAGSAVAGKDPNFIYANGIGTFLEKIHLSKTLGVAFALMAFNTFVYDTLDVCTRLGRFIIQELTGWRSAAGRWFGTILTAGVPAFFVMKTVTNAQGKIVPVWSVFWPLFGASNQLLAALTLVGVTVWLWRTRRAWWVFPVVGLPAVLMYVMSLWALVSIVRGQFANGVSGDPVAWISVTLIALAILVLIEALLALVRRDTPASPSQPVLVPAAS